MDQTNPYEALEEPAEQNPYSALEEDSNPFAQLQEGGAVPASTASQMQSTLEQVDQDLPEVTVQARGGPQASWGDVASALPTAIVGKVETKIAGAQEAYGSSVDASARKKLWQSMVLPEAVRRAKEQGIPLTEDPDVVDIAQHLGIRADQFTRDWPAYVNQSQEERRAFQAKQRERIQSGQAQAEAGAQRRKTAAKVSEAYTPNMTVPQSIAFGAATMLPDLLAGTAATVATGGIGGAAVMGGLIAPEEYASARNRGLSDKDAGTYAALSTLAGSVPEIPVFKILENTPGARKIISSAVGDRLAGTAAGKIVGTSVTSGVTQTVSAALQEGIDEKLFDEDTPLPEALKRIAEAGVTGAVVGAPLGALHAGTSREPRAAPQKRVELTIGEIGVGPSLAKPSEATTPSLPVETAEGAKGGRSDEEISPVQPLEGQELHQALKAVEDKSVSPGQLERLESMGLATRTDVNEPRITDKGAASLKELDLNPPRPTVTHEPGSIEHRVATDPDLREGLQAMKDETGWAEEGGKLLLDTSGQVSGRTVWIPRAEWWPGRPKGLTEAQVHEAVDKAIGGERLTSRQRSMVEFMADVHAERVTRAHIADEARQAVPDIEEQPKPALDLTVLARRAHELDPEAAGKIIDGWEDDRPETIARVQGDLEKIIGHGQQTESSGTAESGEDGRAPQEQNFQEALKRARAETHVEPTDGQKSVGNYRKGRLDFAGMEVALENPKGSTRTGVKANGEHWSREMAHDYGYFPGSRSSDKEGVDVFLTGKPDTGKMFVINQIDPKTGKYDEAKVVAGAASAAEAQRTYEANYPKEWKGLGSMAEMSTAKFREWLYSGDTHKPVRTAVERRTETAKRKKVAEMSAEEAKKELLTHELTGIPNRRAYQESEKLSHQVSIDVDSLKAVNDVGGHHAGDALLKEVASVLREETEHAYHLSGDEFAAQAHTAEEAHRVMAKVADRLKDSEIIVQTPDGKVFSLKGIGVSYGVGEDLGKADTALQAHKKEREAQGLRAARGETPRGLTIGPAKGRGPDRGREARAQEVGRTREKPVQSGRLSRIHVEQLVARTIVDSGHRENFPHVHVHEDHTTLPEHLRRVVEQEKSEKLASALYDPSSGDIHLIAGNHSSEQELRENLWHEAVGHHGLALAMDPERYAQVMDGINRDMPEAVKAAAHRNGLDLNDTAQRRSAAEEVIAYAAGKVLTGQPIEKPLIPWYERAVRAIRAFFSKVKGRPFYDEKAIAALIDEAHTALARGTSGGREPRFSQHAPIFHSAVERAVTDSKQGKASADQWLATIKRQPGVKPEELEWLDLENWLKSHEGAISKDELTDYVRANRLELKETILGGKASQLPLNDEQIQSLSERLSEEGFDPLEESDIEDLQNGGTQARALLEDLHDRLGVNTHDLQSGISEVQRDVTRRAEELRSKGLHVSFNEDGTLEYVAIPTKKGIQHYRADDDLAGIPKQWRTKVEELRTQARMAAQERLHGNEVEAAQYGEYTLPGGENYREMLLRLPQLGTRRTGSEGGIFAGQPISLADNEVPAYRSSHWKEPNIVAHVRFNERTDPDGKKVLFLEELQSDWHQKGRNKGYTQPVSRERMAQITARLDQIQRELKVSTRDSGEYHALDVEERILQEELSAAGKVPDAPFKTSWPMLVMKRMVRWAAENGFDRIAWMTGDQQNERYGLEKHLENLGYSKNEDGTYHLQAKTKDGYSHGIGEAIPDAELPSYVGQELAQRIRNGEGEEAAFGNVDMRMFRGLDLKTGGSGMRGFYDDILPRETSKFIKKYGGKVQSTKVDTLRARMEMGDAMDRAEDPNFRMVVAHGFDITPEMREAALGQGFPLFSKRQEEMELGEPRERGFYPAVRRAVDYLLTNPVTADIHKLVYPVTMSGESRHVARIAAENLGVLAHEGAVSQEHLEQFSRQIDQMPVEAQLRMMDDIENGRPQVDPGMQPVADAMRKMLDDWRDRVRNLGEGYLDNFIENYFPHYWNRPGQAQRMVASIMGRRPLRGPASFLKMRTIPTIKEGMDAGLKPLTVNPLVMTLLKVREMQRFVSGVTMMRRFKEEGLAKFLPNGRQIPDGWVPINDNIAKVRSYSEAEKAFIERGQYIMPEHAARVINNHVSRSALKEFAPAVLFKAFSNALNAMQLGFSAFHLGFTTLDAMISKNAVAIERLMHGEFGRAGAAFAEGLTPVGAVANVRRGHALLNAYMDPAGATPEMQKLVRSLEMAGGRAHMDRYFQISEGVSPFRGTGVRSLARDIHGALTAPTDKLERLAQATKDFPRQYATRLLRDLQALGKTHTKVEIPFEVGGRIVRASTSWIMEHLVPMQKLGVFSDLAADHLRRHPFEAQPERETAMQKIWASVDNRLGEMVYDNLFWNRTFKDVLHFGIRAVGWNLGTVREIGGAPVDLVKLIDKGIREGKISADDVGHKIPYVMAMSMTTALLGATISYLYTGKGPEELKDYFFPKTGGTTNYGTDERVSLPAYVKDIYEYSQKPGETVLNKLNPIFSVVGHMWMNEDFFGNPITDPDAGPLESTGQRLKYLAGEFTPFSFQGRQQMKQTDGESGFVAGVKKFAPFVGVTPAPGYITSPEQIERKDRYQREQKYTKDLKYKWMKALQDKDKVAADEYAQRYRDAMRHLKETEVEVKKDRGKAAVARRKNATALRQQGLPATAALVDSLPLELDSQAIEYFQQAGSAA